MNHEGMNRFAVALLSMLVSISPPALAAIPTWVFEAMTDSTPPIAAKAAAVVLLDDVHLTVSGSGVITTRHRRVMKILTNRGRSYGDVVVPFDNDTRLVGLHGWSLDGGVRREVRERDAVELTPYDFQLFSDARVKILHIPAADPGSIVAWEYERRERPYLLESTWYFQQELPVLRARFSAELPADWRWEAHWSRYPPGDTPAETPEWELRDVPPMTDESRSGDPYALSGRLGLYLSPPGSGSVDSHHSWTAIGQWFARLAAPREMATPELQTQVRALATPDSPERSLRAIAGFVQKDVRYVAVEVGIGGYQPHAAADVIRNRYGDCKDKATLLKTMLREAGIESYQVLVSTSRGNVDPAFPTMGAFNHVILAIRAPERLPATIESATLGHLLLFDPTSTTTALGDLPSPLQGGKGLLVTPSGGELIELPVLDAEVNQLRRKASLRLAADGTLSGTVEEVRTGSIASAMRSELSSRSAGERVKFIESMLAQHLASYTVSDVIIENLDALEKDLVIRYSLRAPAYAKRAADMVLIRPRVLGQKAESIVDLTDRKRGYVTDGPSLQTDDVTIAIDPPLAIEDLPPAVHVETPAVRYDSTSEVVDGALHYRRRYTLGTFFVDRKGLPALNEAFSRIVADERASAVLK
jgi:Domain of Unknown Function with PDB structure (DUF3857)/Transglutaminase-like superfamily